MTEVLSPLRPEQMPKDMRRRFEALLAKVVCNAVVESHGRGLLETIYCAGFYHGVDTVSRLEKGE